MLRISLVPFLVIEILFAYVFILKYGFLNLVLEVIATAILGVFLMLRVGFFQFFSRAIFLKTSDIFGAFGMAIGGFLLFIPGLISDILGAAIAIWSILTSLRGRNKTKEYDEFEFRTGRAETRRDDSGEIIDVEIIEENKTIKK